MLLPIHKLSVFTLAISSSAFIAGLVAGTVSYVERSPDVAKFIPGSNAVPVHIVVVLVSIGLVLLVIKRHARMPKGTLILLAPFSKSASTRFRRTLLMKDGLSLGKTMAAVACVPLGFFCLFLFWRAGLQVIGGLDPNFVTNAWGGPTYIGASLIHWLDAILMFYVGVSLLNAIMPKRR